MYPGVRATARKYPVTSSLAGVGEERHSTTRFAYTREALPTVGRRGDFPGVCATARKYPVTSSLAGVGEGFEYIISLKRPALKD